MTEGPTTTPARRRWSTLAHSWWLLGATLLLAGAVVLSIGIAGGSRALPPPAPSAAAKQAAVPTPTTLPTATPLSTARSVPVLLRIPALGLSVSLGSLGVTIYGTAQVPDNTVQPGWFDLGPTPGQIGSAVILGHVDSAAGVGVFFSLRTLAAGDQVFVVLADGDTVQFAVDSVAMYDKTAFPSERVYSSDGSSALQLVTCGGVFDHQTGSYLSNVVVYTSLVSVTPGVPAPAPTGAVTPS